MEKKRLYGLVLFGFIFTSLFVGVVSAQTPASAIFDPIKDLFANWDKGELSVNIAKYVFWGILGLLVYSILFVIPFVKDRHVGFKIILAVLISFLSIAYLTPSDIYTMLASYGALGIVMGAVIPFMILLFFSIEMDRQGGVGGKMFSKLVWFAFILFLIYKIISGINQDPGIDVIEGVIYLGFIVFALIWVFWLNRAVMKVIFKEEEKAFSDTMTKRRLGTMTAELQVMNKQLAVMAPGDPGYKGKVKEYNEMAAKVRANGGGWDNWGG